MDRLNGYLGHDSADLTLQFEVLLLQMSSKSRVQLYTKAWKTNHTIFRLVYAKPSAARSEVLIKTRSRSPFHILYSHNFKASWEWEFLLCATKTATMSVSEEKISVHSLAGMFSPNIETPRLISSNLQSFSDANFTNSYQT
jgi:hypothetical protein